LVSYLGETSVQFDTFYIAGTDAPYDTIPLVNVVATMKGSIDTTQYYVVGGHFDATANRDALLNWDNDWKTARAPGADDNASGVAAMLEIARVFSDPANSYSPPVTLKFIAFGAEESHPVYGSGHQGSGNYVVDAFVNKDKIAGAFILDMFGFNDTGNTYFNIVSNTKSAGLGRAMLEAIETYQIDIDCNAEPFPYATYSDHERFWTYAYKAILLIENAPPWQDNLPWYRLNPFYHHQSDTPEKVNYDQVYKVTQVTLAAVVDLSDEITAVETVSSFTQPVEDFTLFQNYPNPFNPSTNIDYRITRQGKVVLEIYNLNGQKVASLIDGEVQPGRYSHRWTATNENGGLLPTGIYFVSMRFNNRQTSKKIMLLK
jgi:hypothetical protein